MSVGGTGESRREENIGKAHQTELWEGRDPALVNSGSQHPAQQWAERTYRNCWQWSEPWGFGLLIWKKKKKNLRGSCNISILWFHRRALLGRGVYLPKVLGVDFENEHDPSLGKRVCLVIHLTMVYETSDLSGIVWGAEVTVYSLVRGTCLTK